jgi:hypothetical protein
MASALTVLALFLLGLGLAFGGFLLFRTALYGLGLLLGLSAGLAAFASGTFGDWGIVVLVAAPLLGVALAGIARLLIIAIPGAIGGAFVTATATDTALLPLSAVEPSALAPVVAGALVGIVVAYFLETAIAVVVTASWGATLVSLALGGATLEGPGAVADLVGALYIAIVVLGVVAQVALWYYLRTTLDDDEDAKRVLLRRAGKALGSRT